MSVKTGWRWDESARGPRKPLYLQGGLALRVSLDGPALVVRQPVKAAMLYPLARLARVISRGAVDWDHLALLGCAEAGVPVVFLHRDGAVRAYWFGGRRLARDPHDLLYTRLRARLSRPGGMARYEAWRRGKTQAAERALRQRLGLSLTDGSLTPLPCLTTHLWRQFVEERERALLERRLRGLLAGLSAQVLAEAGLDAARWCKLNFQWDLIGDLAELLSWELVEPVLAALQKRCVSETGPNLNDEAQLTAWFEAHTLDLWRLGRQWLHHLRQWLETCEPWRERDGFT